MRNAPRVAICAPTFKRPVGLGRLLQSLEALDIGGLDVHLIVADNDIEASAREMFDLYASKLPFPATYVVEPSRGLAAVRNRLVAEADAVDAEFMVSVDDDQTVDAGWVRELVQAAIGHDAAAVAPQLQHAFPPGTPQAIQHCFIGPHFAAPTGTRIRIASTNGSLFQLRALHEVDGPFDMRLNFSGGEDSLLSLELAARGGKLIKCRTAIVTEHMPESRLNVRWILERGWREGNIRSQEVRWVNPSTKKSIINTALFAGYAGKNALMIIPDVVRYRTMPIRRLRLIVFGLSGLRSMLLGAAEIEGYRATHNN